MKLHRVGGSPVARACGARIRRITAVAAIGSIVLAACASSGTGVSSDPAASSAPVRQLLLPRAGLYAEASRVGDMVWTAGHLPEGVLVTASIEEQVTQVLDNLEETLEAAGAGFDTVVHANVYLTSFDDWEGFNSVFFERLYEFGLPPRSAIAVSELGFGYRVEIEMVAHVRAPGD